jgi:predicted transcriptional regulator
MRHLLEVYRLDPRKLLEGVRGDLLDAILGDPGVCFTDLVKAVRGPRSFGVVLHHLFVLERLGLVRSVKVARHRRYYALDVGDIEAAALSRTEPYRGFLAFLRENPGLWVSAMARENLGRTRQALQARLRRLSEAGLVKPRAAIRPSGQRVVAYWAVPDISA